ncbi:oxygenase MpaB family protein [Nonomuraea endophytica]|uniref:oxygenase MpaB family protein n=1 Tax=Nonomuraea endophytica TaxID=714136 RepID=UPI0037C5BAD5
MMVALPVEDQTGPLVNVPRWPTERSTQAAVLAQFGRARAELMGWALTTGDPLADAVVEEIHAHGRSVRAALQRGIAEGLGALTDPPPGVAALLTQSESLPDYVDDELLDRGSLPYFAAPPPAHAISLSAGALVRTYESPSIAQVLAMTGRLVEGAPRRLQETALWVNTVMLPGSLRRGQPGYVATLQVRMLHAHMRRLARTRGYDEAALGVPINQVDLARTWMDFTLTPYRAEERMGWALNTAEAASLYRYWWYVAHLLGIDARLVEGIRDHTSAQRVDDLLQAVTGPPIPESGQLAMATLRTIAGELHQLARIPPRAGLPALFALTRRFHGNARADELNLPAAPILDAVLAPLILANRLNRARRRRNPAAWRRRQEGNIAAARALTSQNLDQATFRQ